MSRKALRNLITNVFSFFFSSCVGRLARFTEETGIRRDHRKGGGGAEPKGAGFRVGALWREGRGWGAVLSAPLSVGGGGRGFHGFSPSRLVGGQRRGVETGGVLAPSFRIRARAVSSSERPFFFFLSRRGGREKKQNKVAGFPEPEQAFPLREEAAIPKRAGSSASAVSRLSSSGVLCLELFFFFKKPNYKADALTD